VYLPVVVANKAVKDCILAVRTRLFGQWSYEEASTRVEVKTDMFKC
jgi:hypothetical protein